MAKGCAVVAETTTGKIQLAEAIDLATNGVTVTGWIKATGVTANTTASRPFIVMRTAGGGFAFLGVRAGVPYTDHQMDAQSGDGTVTGWTDGPEIFPPPAVNTWYAYALSFKEGTDLAVVRAYNSSITQLMEDVGSGSASANTLDWIELGTWASDDSYMGCSVAQGRVWQSILTEGQIEAELASSSPVITSGLISAFEDDPTTDISGNANPWTVSNVTTSAADWPPNYSGFTPRSMLLGVG